LWTSERDPGATTRAGKGHTLAREIPPNGSTPFTVQRTIALPTRSDGQFQTKVAVTGMTLTPVRSSTY
jgi:hypothetical protein